MSLPKIRKFCLIFDRFHSLGGVASVCQLYTFRKAGQQPDADLFLIQQHFLSSRKPFQILINSLISPDLYSIFRQCPANRIGYHLLPHIPDACFHGQIQKGQHYRNTGDISPPDIQKPPDIIQRRQHMPMDAFLLHHSADSLKLAFRPFSGTPVLQQKKLRVRNRRTIFPDLSCQIFGYPHFCLFLLRRL